MYFSPAVVLAALPFLVAAAPAPETGVSIPIQRRARADKTTRESVVANIRASVAKVQRGLEAYQRNTGEVHHLATVFKPASESKKRATGSDALTDDEQELWYGKISVGTPAVTYTVDFDTGSSDLFLPGSSCGSTCSGHTLYNPSKSSTAKTLSKSFKLTYGDGSSVSGTQYTDTVTIAGLTATKQTLGSAKTYSTGFESDEFPADGLLGMGFKSLSNYNANPFFQTLVSQGTVSKSVFGFKLADSGSSLYLGGTDSSLYTGAFTYVDLTEASYWELTLGSLAVGSTKIISSTAAIIDTGTTQIIGSSSSVKKAYKAIGGATDNGDGTYSISCDSSPDISITLGGKSFSVSAASFNLPNGDGTCIGGLGYDDEIAEEFWILGDVFLQNVYTAFDVGNERVGFAALA